LMQRATAIKIPRADRDLWRIEHWRGSVRSSLRCGDQQLVRVSTLNRRES
jgi:hypothetical protein